MNTLGHRDFWTRYYKALEGRRIVETGLSEDGYPFFVLDNGFRVEVSQDPEGNGPGFLFGLPEVAPSKAGK